MDIDKEQERVISELLVYRCILYPRLTPNEKEIKRLTKLMRAKKKQETRDKYQVRIDALIEMNRREL